nr:hypothetical protein [Limosilactobacillus mucosae]
MAKKKVVERVLPLVEMSREKRNKSLFEKAIIPLRVTLEIIKVLFP